MSSSANLSMSRPLHASGTRRLAAALTAERVAVLSLFAVGVLFAVVTWNRWGDLWLDSGYDLVAAAKVSHANAPYIDYDYWYGPLGALLLGSVYEVFGIGIGPSVGLGLVLAFTAIGMTYAVARLLVGFRDHMGSTNPPDETFPRPWT